MSELWFENLDMGDQQDVNVIKNAKKLKPLNLQTGVKTSCDFIGEHGSYHTTLTHCDCPSFTKSRAKLKKPCKHMVALAAQVGLLSLDVNTGLYEEAIAEKNAEIRQANDLALAYGMYYLFDAPIVSDEEYDRMKAAAAHLLPRNAK